MVETIPQGINAKKKHPRIYFLKFKKIITSKFSLSIDRRNPKDAHI